MLVAQKFHSGSIYTTGSGKCYKFWLPHHQEPFDKYLSVCHQAGGMYDESASYIFYYIQLPIFNDFKA